MTSRRGDVGSSSARNGWRGRLGRVGLGAAIATCACVMQAGAAQASTVTVGSVLPLSFTPSTFGEVETLFNTTLPEKGANLTSPVNGTVVRWRMQGANGGPYYLRVLQPVSSGDYEATGSSTAAMPSGPGLQTFSTNIPIQSGDLIGIDPTHAGDGIGVATVPGANYAFIFPPPFDGATVAPSGGEAGKEIELSAEVQPAPSVSSIEPSAGSIAGGTVVKIAGKDLEGASAVKFGSAPAASFTAESDTQLAATAPPSVTGGSVDVTVTTAAGTSMTSRADRFSYEACEVPRLRGTTVRVARRVLAQADCQIGKVTGKGRKVASQSPKPGAVEAPGSRVSVKLAKKKRPRRG